MRITNKMMTNNMLYNINSNKNSLNKLEEQYSTGMKIQKPSDDPIIAVRALKLRTNLTELNQYYEKNIPDAKSWMESTESALRNSSDIITQIHTYCVQGANDTLTEEERNSIAENLEQLKNQIYQEGNANYAGRYLFTGYKTDVSLVFGEDEKNFDYTIREMIGADKIHMSTKLVSGIDMENFDVENLPGAEVENKPTNVDVYRVRLSYGNLKSIADGASFSMKIPEVDAEGNYVYDEDGELQYTAEYTDADINVKKSTDKDAYIPEDDEITLIENTGELVFGKNVYNQLQNSSIEITYDKNQFKKNELRPEHYFDCIARDLTIEDETEREEKAIAYTKQNQEIEYEVNFNQRLTINSQGRDSFSHDLGRCVDEIINAVNASIYVQKNIELVEEKLKDSNVDDEKKQKLCVIKEALNTEKILRDEIMRLAYENGIKEMKEQETFVNVAVTDIGSRYNRLELTENRLKSQQTEFTDLLSQNEDADIVDTIVNFNSMNTIYNASLSASAKVVQHTLLDFL